MVEENNFRLVFRPTKPQLKRFNNLMSTGHFVTMSDLLRQILEIGLDELEKNK